MKSTNLYSGLAIILAAAANTAVVGCAGVDDGEDAIDTESSVQSVSSPCDEAQNNEEAVPQEPAQGVEGGGAPCNSGAARQSNYSASRGGTGAPLGGYGASQGGYGASQGGYGPAQGEMAGGYEAARGDVPVSGTYYNRSVTIQTVGAPPGGYGGYGAGIGGYGGYGAGIGGCGGYGGYGAGIGGCGGYGLGMGGYGLGLGGYGLGLGGYGPGFRRGW